MTKDKNLDHEMRVNYDSQALYSAAANGEIDAITKFIESGCDINAKFSGMTPLFIAAKNGHTGVVLALVEAGANLDKICRPTDTDIGNQTALMLAVQNGQLDIVKALINAKANLDLIDENSRSALAYAAISFEESTNKQLYLDIFEELLKAGASYDDRTEKFANKSLREIGDRYTREQVQRTTETQSASSQSEQSTFVDRLTSKKSSPEKSL